MLILWFTIGYWHGGAWTFIIGCGLLHWFYIVSGKLMEPLFVKWRAFFHIEKEKKGFILFQRVRTFFLVMIGLVFSEARRFRMPFGCSDGAYRAWDCSCLETACCRAWVWIGQS